MKKHLILNTKISIILAFVFFLSTNTFTSAISTKTITITTEQSYPIIAKIYEGQIIEIIDTTNLPADNLSSMSKTHNKVKYSDHYFPKYQIPLPKELQKYTYTLCENESLPYDLVLSLIKIESDFKPDLIHINTNSTIDIGLTQINSRYQKYHCNLFGIKKFNPKNPKDSIDLCVKLLSYYKKLWTNSGVANTSELWKAVLLSYNRGLEQAKQYIREHGYKDTYVDKILYQQKCLKQKGRFKN